MSAKRAKKSTTSDSSKNPRTPFNNRALSDIIFTTSDDVEFHLAKVILIHASPFFADMFSLTQPAAVESEIGIGELQRIPISEDSKTFDALMRYCYPVDDPVLSKVVDIERVLEAALKYQTSEAAKILRKLLRGFVTSTDAALRVYAIACRLKCEQEAVVAADFLKNAGFTDDNSPTFANTVAGAAYIPAMTVVTAAAYYRLITYLRPNGTKPSFFTRAIPKQSSAPTYSEMASDRKPPSSNRMPADIMLESSDGVDIPAHSAILRLAGAAKLLEAIPTRNTEQGIPVYSVDIPSEVLYDLLLICYPLSTHIVTDLRRLAPLIKCAKEYGITDVVSSLRKQLADATNLEPGKVYFLASQQGWSKEALAAARRIASQRMEAQYVPEMEETPAADYNRLLRFCHRYADTIAEAIRSQVGVVSAQCTAWRTQAIASTDDTSSVMAFLIAEMAIQVQAGITNPRWCPYCQKDPYYGGHPVTCFTRSPTFPKNIQDILSSAPKWKQAIQDKLSEITLEVDG